MTEPTEDERHRAEALVLAKWRGSGTSSIEVRACAIGLAANRAELERLQQWVNDLQAGMYINCVYCGHRYGPDDEVPATMAEVLKEHIAVCPKHPLAEARAECERLREALVTIRGATRDRGGFTWERFFRIADEALAAKPTGEPEQDREVARGACTCVNCGKCFMSDERHDCPGRLGSIDALEKQPAAEDAEEAPHCKYHKEGVAFCMHCHPPPGYRWDEDAECVVPTG